MDIYDQINALRLTAAGEDDIASELYWACWGTLDEDDWTDLQPGGADLGHPDTDYCVTVYPDDLVRVWGAADIAAEQTIEGAWAEAQRAWASSSDEDDE